MSRHRPSPRDRRSVGFTLVEVLVALVIAAIGLQLAFEMFSTHTHLLESGAHERRAVALAGSLLARIGIEIAVQPGASNGDFDHTYRWRLQVTPLPRPGTDAHPVVVPYDVELVVLWSAWLREQSVRLQTLRLAAPPPVSQ